MSFQKMQIYLLSQVNKKENRPIKDNPNLPSLNQRHMTLDLHQSQDNKMVTPPKAEGCPMLR
jgi:hypothetical protein